MNRFIIYFLHIIIFSGCHSKAAEESIERRPRTSSADTASITEKVKEYFNSALSVSEYLEWLKDHKGLTFDEQENDLFRITILYRPLPFETALSIDSKNNPKSLEEYKSLLNIKKDYHYFLVELQQKNLSASELNQSKRKLLEVVRRNIIIMKGDKDTPIEFHSELFPSVVMNQPSQILILVPAEKNNSRLRATILGAPFGLKDLHLDIPQTQFESFPELKL
jgi:hypothetical protein